jgi:WD40 repeat protein
VKNIIAFLTFTVLVNNCFAQQPRLLVPKAHNSEILEVIINKKCDLLLSYSTDKCLIWNLKDGNQLFEIGQPDSKTINANFNSAGTKVLATIDKKGACLFDMANGELEHCYTSGKTITNSAIFLNNEQKIIAAFSDSSIIIWNTKTRNIVSNFKLPFLVKKIDKNFNEDLLILTADSIAFDTFGEVMNVHFDVYKFYKPETNVIYNSNPNVRSGGELLDGVKDSGTNYVNWTWANQTSIGNLKFEIQQYIDTCYFYDSSGSKAILEFECNFNNLHILAYNKSRNLLVFTDYTKILIIDTKHWNFKKITKDPVAEEPFIKSPIFVGNTGNVLTNWYTQSKYQNIEYDYDLNYDKDYFTGPIFFRVIEGSVYFHDRKTDSLLPIFIRMRVDSSGHSNIAVENIALSSDGKKLLISEGSHNVSIWDVKKETILRQLYDYSYEWESTFDGLSFSKNGKYFIVQPKENEIDLWDCEKLFIIKKFYGKNSMFVSDDILSYEDNGIITFYDLSSSIVKLRLIPLGSEGDYIIFLSNGYYSGAKNVLKLLYYVKNRDVITFEQLDVKYNRPDKVLEAIGCKDTALINSYRKAYYKRIKKLGIDTASFRGGYSVPESDFQNRDAIEDEQKTDNLSLHIKGVDSTYKLDRFNIWINEIPLFGQKGFNIKKRNKNDLDTTITIRLSQGVNRIETSILNVNGTESYRMPLQVNYSPGIKSKEKLHFVGIGIDKFADTTYNLQYSVKDIRDLSKKLKEKFGDRVSIDTLFNENVTIANVKEVKKKLLKTSINDKVIISYSGHGLLSKEYDYYLSTYSVNFDKPEINGLPYYELENLLDSIPARKKLMLIDACHSGEVDKDEEFAMNNTADSMGLSKPKGGKTINSKSNQQLGLKNSFELMQSLFVNVGKSTGATIISAAAGNQFALEKGNLKNGVFTYCILEAMNSNSTMTVSQLKSAVGKRVEELTNGLQKPTSRNETINSDWSVW